MMLLQRILFFILLISVSISGVAQEKTFADALPEKLHTSIDKILDDQFAEIEQTLIRAEKLQPKDVLLVTVPLENYIEDILFTINRPATIYPKILYNVLRNLYKQGKSRDHIEQALITMQKDNQFKKMYDAQEE
ncbi:MAG: hypothetical protein EPO24_01185 [Bacteroidetes bacterium]|nr:MAG: hypothetical protein EPO24_01185 [Bacteroidota bacterium]